MLITRSSFIRTDSFPYSAKLAEAILTAETAQARTGALHEREALKQGLFDPSSLSDLERRSAIHFGGNALVNAKGSVRDLARDSALTSHPGFASLSEADRITLVEETLHEHGLDSQYPFGSVENAMASVLKSAALARGQPAIERYASEEDLHRAFISLVHDWQHADGSLLDPRVLFGLNLAKTKGITFAGNTPQERLADLQSFVNDVFTEPGPNDHALMAQARLQLRASRAPLTDAAVKSKANEISRAYDARMQSDLEATEPADGSVNAGVKHWFENAPVLSNVVGFVEGVATGRLEKIINAVPVLSNLYNVEEGLRTGDAARAGMAAITLVPFAGSVAVIAEGAIEGDAAEAAGGVAGLALDFVTLGEGHVLKAGFGRATGHVRAGSASIESRALSTAALPAPLRIHTSHTLTALRDLGLPDHEWGLKIVRPDNVEGVPAPVRPVRVLPLLEPTRLMTQLDGYEAAARPTTLRQNASGMLWDSTNAAHYAQLEGKLYRVDADRANTTPQRPIWNVVSPDGSTRLSTVSLEYQFDPTARVGRWQVAQHLPKVKGGAPDRPAPTRPNFFDGFAAIQASRRARLERLRNVSHNSTHFHGSRSGSLIAFHSSTASDIRGSLLPMGALLERQAPVYSGERGNALHEQAFNREHLSVVWEAHFDAALRYATDTSSASRSPIKSRPSVGLPGYESFDANLNQVRETSQARLNEIGDDATITGFVQENFPVVYGLKPSFDKLVDVSSDIAGETGVKGGVDHSEIAVVFVPDDKVQAVASYLQECGYPKPVEPLSNIS
jgi:hypothetical protein